MTIELEKELRNALRRAEDGAGTMAAKDAVKLRPADWHKVCDLSRALLAEIERLREALEPFARVARRLDAVEAAIQVEPMPDGHIPRTTFTRGDLRRASRALTTPSNQEGGDHG